jgi:hypothetical protein
MYPDTISGPVYEKYGRKGATFALSADAPAAVDAALSIVLRATPHGVHVLSASAR